MAISGPMTVADRKVAARRFTDAKRVVVKVGSALLVDGDKGRLNRAWLESLAADVAAMRKRGQELILVSSGAIALARRHPLSGRFGWLTPTKSSSTCMKLP